VSEIRVSVVIEATPAQVWADVEDVASHVEWMADAEEIRFTSERTRGVGTTFECDTRVGPLRLTDVMEITEWDDGARMGVRHVGVVTGTGVFTLAPLGDGSATVFTWTEDLRFPWWLGGPVGGVVGGRVMRWIWKRNLSKLKARIEAGVAPAPTDTEG
jgi:hypothetical protein